MSERAGQESHGDDRPSRAVLDELLAMFEADDLTSGKDIDLDSPEVEALLSGSTSRPVDDDESDSEDEAVEAQEPEQVDQGDEQAPDIVVIEAEDLPDIAYLDEEVDEAEKVEIAEKAEKAEDAGDGGERVFIDDDAELAEVVGSAEAARASGIEPKLRERRDAVRKAQGRKRLRWVALGVFLVVVLIAGLAILGSSWFSIKEVEIVSAVYSRDDLAPIVEDIKGEPVLRLDTGAFETRIRSIPWVEDVRIKTHFPDRATIEVRERAPAATFQGADGRFRVIDREGRVLDVVDGQPADYLLIRSDEPPSTAPGDFATDGFVGAASIATALTPSVAPLVEVVEVANDGSDIRLELTGGTEVLLGDTNNLADKLVRLETVIDDRSEGLPARIDVSTNDVTTSETG